MKINIHVDVNRLEWLVTREHHNTEKNIGLDIRKVSEEKHCIKHNHRQPCNKEFAKLISTISD